MELKTFIVIYLLLLATTIVLVVMKKTHWGSIIGVALFPIYFIWVIIDASRSSEVGKQKGPPPDVVKTLIKEKLRKADSKTLQNTTTLLALAILYENPRNIALPEKHILAQKLLDQYKAPGWIPGVLSVDQSTPVAARQLVYGQEIREDAGLDTAGSNAILAEMLANLVSAADIDRSSAIAFSGDSVALGQTFFAVLPK